MCYVLIFVAEWAKLRWNKGGNLVCFMFSDVFIAVYGVREKNQLPDFCVIPNYLGFYNNIISRIMR